MKFIVGRHRIKMLNLTRVFHNQKKRKKSCQKHLQNIEKKHWNLNIFTLPNVIFSNSVRTQNTEISLEKVNEHEKQPLQRLLIFSFLVLQTNRMKLVRPPTFITGVTVGSIICHSYHTWASFTKRQKRIRIRSPFSTSTGY